MSSTRIQQAQLVLSVPFQQQIMGSLLALCSYIITSEAGTVANHTNRLAYANAILARRCSCKIKTRAIRKTQAWKNACEHGKSAWV